jgi:hypothetical protein
VEARDYANPCLVRSVNWMRSRVAASTEVVPGDGLSTGTAYTPYVANRKRNARRQIVEADKDIGLLPTIGIRGEF